MVYLNDISTTRLKYEIASTSMESISTCFSETGNVSFPDNSGHLTISLHISLHDLQTAAQATTCFRAGHVLSLASNLLITSRKSSGGRLAHLLFWITIGGSFNSYTDPCDFPRRWPESLTSKLRLDKLPKPSLTSRTILRKDMCFIGNLYSPNSPLIWIHKFYSNLHIINHSYILE